MSDSDLSSQFAALSDVAARLNAQSDTVNQLIEQFQDKVRVLNVGLPAWVRLETEPGPAARSNWNRGSLAPGLRPRLWPAEFVQLLDDLIRPPHQRRRDG